MHFSEAPKTILPKKAIRKNMQHSFYNAVILRADLDGTTFAYDRRMQLL